MLSSVSTAIRTTLHIDDDVYRAARSLADARGQGLGAVVSDLARMGLRARVQVGKRRRGFPMFDVPPNAPPLTAEMVQSALDDE
jgi:hypothetical protein